MRLLKTLLIGMLFINCSSQVRESTYTYELSSELKPYVFEYLATLEKHDIEFKNQSFIVVFDSDLVRTNLLGVAKGMFNNDLIYVKINPRLWNWLTAKQKKHLIFHELSHDIFNVAHTEEVELMRPSMANPFKSFIMNIDEEIELLMKHIKNGQS